jgi:hypothetical protein
MHDHAHLYNYARKIFECYPALVFQKDDPLRLSLLTWEAYACLNNEHPKTTRRICTHAEKILKNYFFDLTNGRHLEVVHKILLGYAYVKENELNKAIRMTESAIEIAQKMDFKLLMVIALHLLNQIYAELGAEKQLHLTKQQLNLIKTSTSFKQLDRLFG